MTDSLPHQPRALCVWSCFIGRAFGFTGVLLHPFAMASLLQIALAPAFHQVELRVRFNDPPNARKADCHIVPKYSFVIVCVLPFQLCRVASAHAIVHKQFSAISLCVRHSHHWFHWFSLLALLSWLGLGTVDQRIGFSASSSASSL